RYAALSHSWGKAQVITTTSQTLDQYKQCLSYTKLPQTFRDAIKIARRLAIGLLWIDSLCIIQDSTLDWEEQAAKMASVYANATVVIAAESALDGSGGCFISSDERTYTPFEFECPGPEGSKSAVYARPDRKSGPISPFCSSHTRQAWSHLSTRAWVYQEQLLGRRILHYTKSEMAWTCNSANICECQTVGLSPQIEVPQDIIPEQTSLSKRTVLNMWTNFTEEYTRRSVTHAIDRLPAISGIAAACNQHFSGQYLFGIWQDHLPEALLWSVSVTKTRQSQRIESYAPSWSWAS
ncbi:HET-domain-containing protein, partial [Glonium stellatum]